MTLKKIIVLANKLENPKHPLLGPTLKGLYFFRMWQAGSRFRTAAYNIIHIFTFLFVFSQTIDLYIVRHDINKVLNNASVTVLSSVCIVKSFSYIIWQHRWTELANGVSKEELFQIGKKDRAIKKIVDNYTRYTRVVTYLFWTLVLITHLLMITSPLLKYLSSKTYREEISSGKEPLPQILSSWFPFDSTKMPGYLVAVFIHIIMASYGSLIVAAYDMNAVAIMSYLKGQMAILRVKCKEMFEENEATSRLDILERISECHRHHNMLMKHYQMFNTLLSPIMFLYVLLCSITICCSVVQFSAIGVTFSEKVWVVQYTLSLVFQLFVYCWHGNEVSVEASDVDRGVYECDWWKGDVRTRRLVLLLAGKLTYPFILHAGPFTTLSVPTFINIMKGSYSFYTIFSQMQDNK